MGSDIIQGVSVELSGNKDNGMLKQNNFMAQAKMTGDGKMFLSSDQK